jgi:hypothetical protein
MDHQIGRPSQSHRTAQTASATGSVPGKRTLVEQHPAPDSLVQRKALGVDEPDPRAIHAAAARGTATPASPLPNTDRLQRAFGRHDLSTVQAHVGGDAATAASSMGAVAYATGNHVVLGRGADLFTEAHEAAHVVQQRAGVQLAGGIGQAGDAHERHADEVASLVVQGKSAAGVLDQVASPAAGPAAGTLAVQSKEASDIDPVQEKLLDALIKAARDPASRAAAIQRFAAITAEQAAKTARRLNHYQDEFSKYFWHTVAADLRQEVIGILTDKVGNGGPVPTAPGSAATPQEPNVAAPAAPASEAPAAPVGPPAAAGPLAEPTAPPPQLQSSSLLLAEFLLGQVRSMQAAGKSIQEAQVFLKPYLGDLQPVLAGASSGVGGGPSGKAPQPRQLEEGNTAHRAIQENYQAKNPGTIAGGLPGAQLDVTIEALLGHAGGLVPHEDAIPGEIADALKARPDILDAPKLELYEIKPVGSTALAVAEALWYIEILEELGELAGVDDLVLSLGSPQNDGTRGILPLPDGRFCVYFCPAPGALVYRMVDQTGNPRHELERMENRASGAENSIGVETITGLAVVGGAALAGIAAAADFPSLIGALENAVTELGGAGAVAPAGG